jgi:hypothetical protein
VDYYKIAGYLRIKIACIMKGLANKEDRTMAQSIMTQERTTGPALLLVPMNSNNRI